MATNETLIPIPGRLHSVAEGQHVAGADEIYDDSLETTQASLNSKYENATAQTTVSSTDYILLKDTNGVPHKILKGNFVEDERGALDASLKTNDLGTGFNRVITSSDNNGLGSTTFATLLNRLNINNGWRNVFITGDADTWKADFENYWSSCSQDSGYFGLLRCGWEALYLGMFGSSTNYNFIIFRYYDIWICKCSNGTVTWSNL